MRQIRDCQLSRYTEKRVCEVYLVGASYLACKVIDIMLSKYF